MAKYPWLSTCLKFPHGVPSHDTFGNVFTALDPEATSGGIQHAFSERMEKGHGRFEIRRASVVWTLNLLREY